MSTRLWDLSFWKLSMADTSADYESIYVDKLFSFDLLILTSAD